jgi:hypothetical protein
VKRLRRRARGATLIEGMTAAAVLAIGILGTMQSLLLASQQNAIATKMARAAEIAREVRDGLDAHRYGDVVAPGKLLDMPARCSGVPAVVALTDGMNTMVPLPPVTAPCVIDLDAYEMAALPTDLITPGYDLPDGNPATREDGDLYRRVLVVTTEPGIATITVVVTFRAGLRTVAVRQTTAMYDPAVNQAGTDNE